MAASLAGAMALHKRSATEKLQMSGCIGEGEARTRRQIPTLRSPCPRLFEQFELVQTAAYADAI
jgi:hypothetical protein